MERPPKRPFENIVQDDAKKQKRENGDADNNNNNSKADVVIGPPGTTFDWSKYRRPPLPPLNPKTDCIDFQKTQIDYHIGDPTVVSAKVGLGKVPIIRIYGVTRNGNSVQCNIHNFFPYFYVDVPEGFNSEHYLALFAALTKFLQADEGTKLDPSNKNKPVISVDEYIGNSIMGYCFRQKRSFIKITLCSPKIVPTIRTLLEKGFDVKDFGFFSAKSYESNIAYVLRFMFDVGLVGGGWMGLKSGTYNVIPPKTALSSSDCQLELEASWYDVVAYKPEGEWSVIAPLRTLSFDIECAARKGLFPEPKVDPVIQISFYVHEQGKKDDEFLAKGVLALRETPKFDDESSLLLWFKTEKELLLAWKRFLKEIDPDILIGYNIANFDLYYLWSRAQHLKLEEFLYLGKLTKEKGWMKASNFSSKGYGKRESWDVHISGRIIFDILQVIQREYKLRSYSLNAVSARFLEDQKEDVDHSMITTLFEGTPLDRMRLAVYNLKDSYLPLRLMQKLMIMYNYMEMARVTGVPFDYLTSKGQQIKVLSQLYRKAKTEDLLIPFYTIPEKGSESDVTYKGATVMEPHRGFHDEPVATLDFKSLYPTIMIGHNLCYSTLLKKAMTESMPSNEWEQTPTGDYFVRSGTFKGLLPRILEELLAARQKVKDELKNEKDPFKKAVLSGRELALKVSTNSVYGFTGAVVGRLPCMAISASVTAYGRDMIWLAKTITEDHFSMKNGYSQNPVVIYGDTDSIMVKFGPISLEESMKRGKEGAKVITDRINMKPIELAFEKIYFPYLLISKKRYAGLFWTKPEKYDKLDSKGIESVRRDSCPLTAKMVDTSLRKILIDRSVEKAQEYVKGTITDLMKGNIDLSLLVITKALSKSSEDYAVKQAHAELAKRIAERNPDKAYGIGDRVKYVMIANLKKAKNYEKAEDPVYAIENDLQIDYDYYLTNQITKPMKRIFKSVMENPESLLQGDHTKFRIHTTPKTGPLTQFLVKTPTCLKCRATLTTGYTALCKHCDEGREGFLQSLVSRRKEKEEKHDKLWAQCKARQGINFGVVDCINNDCPIFYERFQIKKDLAKATEDLKRFNLDDKPVIQSKPTEVVKKKRSIHNLLDW